MLSTKKLIEARLGVSRPIYVNVDSPNLGFPYFNFLGGYQWKKTPCTYDMYDPSMIICTLYLQWLGFCFFGDAKHIAGWNFFEKIY